MNDAPERVNVMIMMHVTKVDYDHIADMVQDLRDKGADVHVRIVPDRRWGAHAFPTPWRWGRDYHT
jgi:hypothetical protein